MRTDTRKERGNNMRREILVLVFTLALPIRVFAHEGHGIPGALPPAPHGGVVQEAKHDEEEHGRENAHDDHDHEEGEKSNEAHAHEEEPELFFEAVYKNKELRIFPLILPEGNNPMFKALSPSKEFASVSMRIEFPRAKTSQEVKAIIEADAIRAPFDAKKVNRFIIHLNVKQKNEEKRASIQLENG
jgi:hypothetical protein